MPNYAAIIDLNNLDEIAQIIDDIKEGKKGLIYDAPSKKDKAQYPIVYSKGKLTGVIPISEGCVGSCTYCCVKHARGRLFCYDRDFILHQAESQLKQGIKQIYLTSQDCSVYEYEGINLKDLVERIVNLDYKFFLRIGMINPRLLLDNFDQIISILKLPKVYKLLHLPLQSGSDDILQKMNRPYRISKIIDKLDYLRKKFPQLTLSTDIICGFPGESEYDFLQTVNFIKWLKPEILNISKFTPRPGTKAKKMVQLDSSTIKDRSLRLSNVFRTLLENMNQDWLNWEGEVLLLHEGNAPSQAFGRNIGYKNVFIDGYDEGYGRFVRVQIDHIDGFNLYGKIIDRNIIK